MDSFVNYSAFPAIKFDALDQHDHGFITIAARVTYDLTINAETGNGKLSFSSKQQPLIEEDTYYGEVAHSSVRFESDLAPYKPRLDVIVNGTAYTKNDKPMSTFSVGIKLGDAVRMLKIYGSRLWRKEPIGWSLSQAKAITSLDLRYEYAPGGYYKVDEQEIANPANTVGTGWYPKVYLKKCKLYELAAPQIELFDAPVKGIDDVIQAGGFGFYGRGWKGRIELAGTNDEKWIKERHPFLSTDFNFAYWNGAHPYLQFELPKPLSVIPVTLQYLVSAKEIPGQMINFTIPTESLYIFMTTAQGIGITKDLILDTIVIDLPTRKVFCTYRIALSESLELVETELRYIAIDERHQEQQKAKQMNADPDSDEFIPLPPSLSTVSEVKHG